MHYPPVVLAVALTVMLPMYYLMPQVACAVRAWLRAEILQPDPGATVGGGPRSAVAAVDCLRAERQHRAGAGLAFPGGRVGTVEGGGHQVDISWRWGW